MSSITQDSISFKKIVDNFIDRFKISAKTLLSVPYIALNPAYLSPQLTSLDLSNNSS